jgi:hypothetical protein
MLYSGSLLPPKATPMELTRIAKIDTSDQRAAAAVNMQCRFATFDMKTESFDKMVRDIDEFAVSFEHAFEVFSD